MSEIAYRRQEYAIIHSSSKERRYRILDETSAKGLAAMCGYQCGAKGAAVDDADALPRDRNGDRGFFPLPDASSAYWRLK